MRPNDELRWYRRYRQSHETVCKYCEGSHRHRRWCPTQNTVVSYAYAVASGAARLTLQDELILHGLGVAWTANDSATKKPPALLSQRRPFPLLTS